MTTEQKQLAAIIATAIFLALLTCAWFWGYDRGRRSVKCPVIEKTDTIWHTDTHFVEKPIEVVKWKDREKLVYVPVNKDSLVYVPDTTFIELPREFKQYSGEDYEAVVSGVDPLLESIKVFPKTAYIQNTITTRKRWSFGITAGPGVLYDGSLHGGVGIVAGLQYNF